MVHLIVSSLISSFNKTRYFNGSPFRKFLVCSIPDILLTIWELWNNKLESQTVRRAEHGIKEIIYNLQRQELNVNTQTHNKIAKW